MQLAFEAGFFFGFFCELVLQLLFLSVQFFLRLEVLAVLVLQFFVDVELREAVREVILLRLVAVEQFLVAADALLALFDRRLAFADGALEEFGLCFGFLVARHEFLIFGKRPLLVEAEEAGAQRAQIGAGGFLLGEAFVALGGFFAEHLNPGAEIVVHHVVPVVRRDGAGEARCFAFREDAAELAACQYEDGLGQKAGLGGKAAQELSCAVFGCDDGGGPERIDAAQFFAIAAVPDGGAVGIGTAFERREIIAPCIQQVVENRIGCKCGGLFILVDKAVRLSAEQGELLLFLVFAHEVVAKLIGQERGTLVEFERRICKVRTFGHEAELFEQVLRFRVNAAEVDGHLRDVF